MSSCRGMELLTLLALALMGSWTTSPSQLPAHAESRPEASGLHRQARTSRQLTCLVIGGSKAAHAEGTLAKAAKAIYSRNFPAFMPRCSKSNVNTSAPEMQSAGRNLPEPGSLTMRRGWGLRCSTVLESFKALRLTCLPTQTLATEWAMTVVPSGHELTLSAHAALG